MTSFTRVGISRQGKVLLWLQDWVSDWFGLFDIAVGIVTMTAYYPQTQAWFLKKCGR